jgi:hypothetical protein
MDTIETAPLTRDPPAARRRFTVEEYYRMTDTGILVRDERIELIEGERVAMAATGSPHMSAVLILNRLFSARIGDTAIVSVRSPVRLDDRTMPEPDIALLRMRPDFYRHALPGPGDILLLIEVAGTSLACDLETKRALYARHRIPEYWVVDVAAQEVHVFTDPDGTAYRSARTAAPGATLHPSCPPGAAIAAAAIFP